MSFCFAQVSGQTLRAPVISPQQGCLRPAQRVSVERLQKRARPSDVAYLAGDSAQGSARLSFRCSVEVVSFGVCFCCATAVTITERSGGHDEQEDADLARIVDVGPLEIGQATLDREPLTVG
jgi:hypothetical protein